MVGKIIPKGEKTYIINSAGKKKEFPNALGSRQAYHEGKIYFVNRKVARQKNKDRSFTSKGYAFGNKIGGRTLAIAEHIYKKNEKKIKKVPAEPITTRTGLTNHERHFIRRKTREQRNAS